MSNKEHEKTENESKPKKKVTIQQVAQLAGVSGATVSYILNGSRNGKSRASESTRTRVRSAAEELGYIPNAVARNQQRPRTESICLITSKLTPENMVLARHLQARADKEGYQLLISTVKSKARELQFFYKLQKGVADGAIIFDSHALDGDYYRQLAQSGLSLVVIDDQAEPDNFDVVQHNLEAVCKQAIDLLVAKGHKHIAVLGDMTQQADMRMIKRYINLIQSHGIEVDYQYIKGEVRTEADAYEMTQAFFEIENPPTALVAASAPVAAGALLGAQDAGKSVPDDLAILGLDGVSEMTLLKPAISTIAPKNVDYEGIVEMLFNRMSTRGVLEGRQTSYEYELILRDSV